MNALTRLALVLGLLIGCGGEGQPPSPGAAGAAPVPPTPVAIDPARKDLVFRYLDPSTGEVATAGTIDAIPQAARGEVVVYDPNASLPAGWDLVVNLATGTTAVPRQGFAFATRAAATPSSATPPGTDKAQGQREVVLFSTEGCGYCAKARRFLSDNRVPFTELDVEENPAAPAKLSALGQKAGLGPRDLQGVPILFIDGQPVLGWDQRRVSQLLGIGG